MVTDPISDFINRITNAQAVKAERVSAPFSKVKLAIANVLKSNGYVADIERTTKKARKAELEYLDLGLAYRDGQPAISGVAIVSRPSRHIYAGAKDMKPVRSGFGIAVVSTSKGIMTSKDARKQNIGGEILFEIW